MYRDVASAVVLFLLGLSGAAAQDLAWTRDQLYVIDGLSFARLSDPPTDRTNLFADDPQAAALGEAFFSDTRFSANGLVSCASCHVSDKQFQDGLRVGHGMADGSRRTMPIAGTDYHPFLFWDGRKDSQWSQALGPQENPVEHGADRVMIARLIVANYRADYEAVFGPIPDLGTLPEHASPFGNAQTALNWDLMPAEQQVDINRIFSNLGKAIEAFERTIPVPETRFDTYAAAVFAGDDARANTIFTTQEVNGLRLFLGQGDCVRCHSGPQLTDMNFHNIGLPDTTKKSDSGRSTSVFVVRADPFNCQGAFSDTPKPAVDCFNLTVLRDSMPDQIGSFKSPSLRGVAQRPPYMHTGQFATLHDVLVHYNDAPKAPFGTTELNHQLKLTEAQIDDLEAFLNTLNVGDKAVNPAAP